MSKPEILLAMTVDARRATKITGSDFDITDDIFLPSYELKLNKAFFLLNA